MLNFEEQIGSEITLTKKEIKRIRNSLDSAPEGILVIRTRKTKAGKPSKKFYQVISRNSYEQANSGKSKRATRHSKEILINSNPSLINALAFKRLNTVRLRLLENNLAVCEKLRLLYQSADLETTLNSGKLSKPVFDVVTEKFNSEIEHLSSWASEPYDTNSYKEEEKKHYTINKVKVRSKSEMEIANALVNRGIPFRYEPKATFKVPECYDTVYPDFVIKCPDGTIIIWEHFGRLDDLDYALKAGRKLRTYHYSKINIHENMIITTDNVGGSLNSVVINQMIENYIMSHFKGYI